MHGLRTQLAKQKVFHAMSVPLRLKNTNAGILQCFGEPARRMSAKWFCKHPGSFAWKTSSRATNDNDYSILILAPASSVAIAFSEHRPCIYIIFMLPGAAHMYRRCK